MKCANCGKWVTSSAKVDVCLDNEGTNEWETWCKGCAEACGYIQHEPTIAELEGFAFDDDPFYDLDDLMKDEE